MLVVSSVDDCIAANRSTNGVSHESRTKERTLLTWVPIERWQPAHSRHKGTHRLTDAHSGLAAPQSAHLSPLASSFSSFERRFGVCTPPGPPMGAAPNAAATALLIASAHSFIAVNERACNCS